MWQICHGANAQNPTVGPVCSACTFRRMLPQNAIPSLLSKVLPHTLPHGSLHQFYTESIFRLWDKGAIWITQLMQLFKQHVQHISNKLTVVSGHPTPKLHVTVPKIGFYSIHLWRYFPCFPSHCSVVLRCDKFCLHSVKTSKPMLKREREQDLDSRQNTIGSHLICEHFRHQWNIFIEYRWKREPPNNVKIVIQYSI